MKTVSNRKDMEALWVAPGLTSLIGEQIVAIVKIIDKELEKSFNFGLELSREHAFKEKLVVLIILNSMGNLHSIFTKTEYGEVMKYFLYILEEMLSEESEFYYEKFSKKNELRNKFNLHLSSIASSILLSICNKDGRIPFL
jgi:hypothetical protein